MSEIAQFTVEEKDISELNAAPYNPREISEAALAGLEASMTRWGMVEPVIWNETTGNVVGGHQRLKVLFQKGVQRVQTIIVKLSLEEEKALNVTLNNKAIQGDWTSELESIISEIKFVLPPDDYLDLQIKALEDEIPEVIDEAAPTHDPDSVPETPSKPKSILGTVYALGNHRVICGDATKSDDYQKLFGEENALMVFTDPPYNVNYEGSKGMKIQNDDMSDDDFNSFLLATFEGIDSVLAPGGSLYVCHADSQGVAFRSTFLSAGFELKQCLIWVKNQLVLGRQDYQWKHEPILYGWKSGASHNWYGKRDKTTVLEDSELLEVTPVEDGFELHLNNGIDSHVIKVPAYEVKESTSDEFTSIWRFEKPPKNPDHPTMKPVGIPSRAIRHSSRKGDIVLDTFLGSGSTLIACEQLGRRCYGFELDPKYCDVVIKRWEDFTGKKAKEVA